MRPGTPATMSMPDRTETSTATTAAAGRRTRRAAGSTRMPHSTLQISIAGASPAAGVKTDIRTSPTAATTAVIDSVEVEGFADSAADFDDVASGSVPARGRAGSLGVSFDQWDPTRLRIVPAAKGNAKYLSGRKGGHR